MPHPSSHRHHATRGRLLILAATITAIGLMSCAEAQAQSHPIGVRAFHRVLHPSHFLNTLSERWTTHMATPKAAPASKTSIPVGQQTIRVAIVSDLNGSYGSEQYRGNVHGAVRWIRDDLRPDLVLSTGDMVAGMMQGLDYEAMWLAFHRAVTLPLSRAGIAFAPTPGNHDGTARPGYEAERQEYARQWNHWVPDVDRFIDRADYPRRYAFVHKGVLFASIDASTVGALPDAHRQWLDEVLTEHADIPVKVVFGHLPIHPFAKGRVRSEVLADADLEALLVRHDVDAYLSGHHHAYYPGRRGDLRMISMACLGGGPRTLMGTDEESPRSVAVLTIDPAQGILHVDAHTGHDFHDLVDRRTLPPSVGRGDTRILRDDL